MLNEISVDNKKTGTKNAQLITNLPLICDSYMS